MLPQLRLLDPNSELASLPTPKVVDNWCLCLAAVVGRHDSVWGPDRVSHVVSPVLHEPLWSWKYLRRIDTEMFVRGIGMVDNSASGDVAMSASALVSVAASAGQPVASGAHHTCKSAVVSASIHTEYLPRYSMESGDSGEEAENILRTDKPERVFGRRWRLVVAELVRDSMAGRSQNRPSGSCKTCLMI